MKINYNVTGSERKSLVAAISQELNASAKYLGAPTFAYEVGDYHIDKNGMVTGSDNPGLIADLCGLHSFKAVSEEYDEPTAEPADAPDFADLELTERGELGLGQERRDPIGENGMQASDVPDSRIYQAELCDPEIADRMEVFSADNDEDALRQAFEYTDENVKLLELFELDEDYSVIRSVGIPPSTDRLTIEIPLDGFTPEKLDNLFKLVNAKAPLLKAALGTDDLPIKQTLDTLLFPWFENVDEFHTRAYSTLVSLLCKTAIEKTRVTAKEKEANDNPKYAMRCFLLSLGFIGAEHRVSRRILLSKLSGNSSWNSNDAYAAMQEQRRKPTNTTETE